MNISDPLNKTQVITKLKNDSPEHSSENNFIKQLVNLILEEYRLIGDPDHVKATNSKLVHSLLPCDLISTLDLNVNQDGLSDAQLMELCRKVIKYSVKTSHPHFYNQLYGGVDQYGLAGAWLSDALNTSQATYEISPVFTIIERKLIEYCSSRCGWNIDEADGIFAPGGSISNMYSMILARHFKFPQTKEKGIHGLGKLVGFCSDNAHYSFIKSSIWMGLGMQSIIKVKTDDRGKMIPEQLEKAILKANEDGKVPYFVACTSGTTVLGAFDPLKPISEICSKYKLWMHVDASLGGTFLLSSKHRHLLDGIEAADSVAWNLHKLAGAPLQASLFLTPHFGLLKEVNSIKAEYIFQNDKYYDVEFDTGDKSIQCGRKVDSLKVWLTLVSKGEKKMEQLVDNIIEMNHYITKKLKQTPGFKLVLPQFEGSTISFWYITKSLRDSGERYSLSQVHEICPNIKEKMINVGTLMINYQPLTCKGLPNFFRLSLTCIPAPSKDDMDFVIQEIVRLAESNNQ